jgi:hypothetical protein
LGKACAPSWASRLWRLGMIQIWKIQAGSGLYWAYRMPASGFHDDSDALLIAQAPACWLRRERETVESRSENGYPVPASRGSGSTA